MDDADASVLPPSALPASGVLLPAARTSAESLSAVPTSAVPASALPASAVLTSGVQSPALPSPVVPQARCRRTAAARSVRVCAVPSPRSAQPQPFRPRSRPVPDAPGQARPGRPVPSGPAPTTAAGPRSSLRRRVRGLASLALTLAAALGVLAVLLLALGPHTGQYRTLTMLTGSMTPQFPAGSVVVVTPERAEDVEVGQVMTFHAPTPDRHVVTHRVIAVDRTGAQTVVRTQGDANPSPDPWDAVLQDGIIWRARGAVPYLGFALQELRGPAVQTFLTRVLPLGLLGWLLVGVWRPASEAGQAARADA